MFIQNIATKPEKKTDDSNTIRIVLPFKDQIMSVIQPDTFINALLNILGAL